MAQAKQITKTKRAEKTIHFTSVVTARNFESSLIVTVWSPNLEIVSKLDHVEAEALHEQITQYLSTFEK
jgi:alpha-D-ribose 1-methylphosphonate 5-triphosphate diphosphatase PhnM